MTEVSVAPSGERGLKLVRVKMKDYGGGRSLRGAWIEIYDGSKTPGMVLVAPSGERGLKFAGHVGDGVAVEALPPGSVD